MKNKELKRALILIVFIIILVVIIKMVQGTDKVSKQLKKIGYNKDEITLIKENLNGDSINKILSLEYNKLISGIVSNKYFIPYNLDNYIEYSKKEEDINKIISMVNTNRDHEFYTNTKQTDISKNYSMLVNKYNYLPNDYTVNDIEEISNWYAYEGHSIKSEVYEQYKKMWKKANNEGLTLLVNSSYRTMEEQKKEYDNSSDEYASRPGFSEHQTGLALDIVTHNIIGNNFENTDEFKWLQNHAHEYGFILRYPKDKENITGYNYESWHYRYLGVELAKKVYESNLTYDEYYAYFCEYKNEC